MAIRMMGGTVRAVGVVGVVGVVRVRGVRAHIGSLETLSKHIQKPQKVLEAV